MMATWQRVIPFVFYMLPEAFLLLLSATGLLGIRIRLARLAIAGFGLWVITVVARSLLFSTMLHTPIILLGLIFMLRWCFGLSYSTAITGCFLGFFLLIMGEMLISSSILAMTRIKLNDALHNPWLHVAFGWMSSFFLILSAIISHVFKLTLINAPESQNFNE